MKSHASMNRIYRLVWNQLTNAWVAVAETAKGRGKGSSRKLIAAALSLTAVVALAGPEGGQVVSGTGSISQSGATTTIAQTSPNLSLTWNSFNVAAQETVNFVQPSASAIAVNRIFDTNASHILGHLNANGQVYLINPNGILFGQGAQVNVGGLVASTLDLSDASLSSHTRSFSGKGTGSVINLGTINATGSGIGTEGAAGGYVALLGNTVSNQGTITAPGGTVALGAGSAATLTFQNNSLVSLQVDQSTLNNLAENQQLIRADGGTVLMSAGAKDALLASVVNNTGVIEARTVENHAGTIVLLGGMAAGAVHVGGTLDASAPSSANGGKGGFIETSAAHVKVADGAKVSTLASHGETGTWLIDPTDFTISSGSGAQTGSGIGADTLSAALGGSNVAISTDAAGSENGDIHVNSAVSWAANKLTLTAHRNININANLNASGTAQLALEYGQASTAGAGSGYFLNNGAKVHLPAGNNFSTRQGSSGATLAYTVITDLGAAGSTSATDLQGINGALAGRYVLGADIDATATAGWNGGAGFAPLGVAVASLQFTGHFDGLGHTVNGLVINRPTTDEVGLFGSAGSGVLVRNVGLVGGSVIGRNNTGSLLGASGMGVNISNVYATGSVVGGTGVGGLVGNYLGNISNAYATGSVTGANLTGGLVGFSNGNIINAYATGNVHGGAGTAGGLVGWHGRNNGLLRNVYATGSVSGSGFRIGGLVGENALSGRILDAYSTDSANPLIGFNTSYGDITNTYTTGRGVFGIDDGAGNIINNYWNKTISGLASSVYSGTGITTEQMMSAGTFTGWSIATEGGSSAVWRIYEGQSGPLLRNFLNALTVTASSGARTYDGTTDGPQTVTYSATPDANLLGSASTTAGSKNVGSHGLAASGLFSTQQGYDITYVDGTLDITPKALTVTYKEAQHKFYDGNTTASVIVGISGFVDNETPNFSASGTFSDKNAATNKTVSIHGTLADGSNGFLAANYSLADVTATGTISPKTLSISGSGVAPKTYDGSTAASVTVGTLAGFVGSETVTAGSSSGTFSDKNSATGKIVTASHLLADGSNGGLASNYSLADEALTGDITPKALTVTYKEAQHKFYDGNTTASVIVGISGFVDNETPNFSASGTFSDKNAATNKTVSIHGTLADGSNGFLAANYSLADVTATGTISPKTLGISGSSVAPKTYDGSTAASVTAGTLAGFVGSETVTAGSSSGTFSDKNSATGKIVTASHLLANGSNGGLASNYSLANETLTGDITPKALTVTGSSAVSKIYDGNNTASITAGTLFGLVDSDTLSASGSGTFSDKNAATGKPVTARYSLSDGSGRAANYTLGDETLTADISPRSLAVTYSGVNKIYDGSTLAVVNTTDDRISGDGLSINRSARFDDKNTATGKTVSVASVSLAGTDAGNYTVAATGSTTADISARSLTVSATGVNKVYDGGTAAAVVLSDNRISNDVLSLDSTTASFADKNVAAGKSVSVGGISVSGTDAGNYSFNTTASTSADITAKALTVSGLTASNKVYDASTTATLGGTATVTALGSDSVTLGGTASGAFDTKDAGMARTVTVTGNTLSGTDAGNYKLLQQTGLSADISPAPLTISPAPVALSPISLSGTRVYDGTVNVAANIFTLSGLLAGQDLSLTGVGTVADKNVGSNKPVTLGSLALGNGSTGLASNYSLSGGTYVASITPAPLSVNADQQFKVFAAADPQLSFGTGALAGSDTLASALSGSLTRSAGEATGVYDINQGSLSSVGGNYTLSFTPGSLRIVPRVQSSGAGSNAVAVAVAPTQAGESSSNPAALSWLPMAHALQQESPQRAEQERRALAIVIVDEGIRLPAGLAQ